MTDSTNRFVQLIEKLKSVKGMVALSGYETELYKDMLPGWCCHTTTSRIAAGRGTALRIEMLWLNPAATNLPGQTSMEFGE